MKTILFDAYQHHGWRQNDVCGTLTVGQNDGVRGDTPLVVSRAAKKVRDVCSIGHDIRSSQFSDDGIADTLTSTDYKQPITVAYEK